MTKSGDRGDQGAARAQATARAALVRAYEHASGSGQIPGGYVDTVQENLVDGVSIDLFCEDFAGAGGQELTRPDPNTPPKFCAVYSSAALAVNTFARWKCDISRLSIFQHASFDRLRFEARCPSGLRGTPPTLDVLLSGPHLVLGIESKCLEYLGRREAAFADAYLTIDGPRSVSPWFDELRALRSDPRKYCRLDAAQLIKHHLGLASTFPEQAAEARAVTLLYLFWEPANWQEIRACIQHREEVAAFGEAVKGDWVSFRSASYRELWAHWERLAERADWLAAHVAALRARYDVTLHW